MAIPEDLSSRDRESLIESTSVPGQTGRVVLNPDGSSIAGGGGGSQYTEGDTDATLTGTVMLMEGAGDAVVPAQGTAADGLLVNLGSNNDVTTDIGLAEDTAHQTGDKGVQTLSVREDSLGASLADTDGDYAPIKTDANGRLYVNNYASAAHDTAASNVFVQSTGSEAKDFDGAALPNSVNAEGDLVRNAASLSGVQFMMPVNKDGSGVAGIAQESSSMTVAGASVTPKFATIDAASAGDNTLVAAVVGKKVRVTSLFVVNGHTSTQTVRFESGAGGTALTGQMVLAANGGFVLPYNPNGWFETAVNTLLNLELAGATTVDGALTYIEV